MAYKTKKSFKNCLFLCFAFSFFLSFLFKDTPLFAQSSNKADDICGEWWTPNNEGRMIFFRSNGKYYGMVSWLKYPNDKEDGAPKRDKLNPNPELRNRLLQNLILFSDFVFNSESGKYTNGKVYDAQDSGNKYSCWLKLIEHNVLEIHGYIGFSLLGKSVFFTRVQK
ncbi:MAG: DUF2147 domain-containing protein [Bacteroidota bacterium]